jgi:hypothetical protein
MPMIGASEEKIQRDRERETNELHKRESIS